MLLGYIGANAKNKTGAVAPPVGVQNIDSQKGTGNRTHALTGVPAGALLVITVAAGTGTNANATITSTPSLVWTKRGDANGVNSGDAEVHTAVFTAGGNISIISGFGPSHGVLSTCYTFINQEPVLGGIVATANNQAKPFIELPTTTRPNSILVAATGDWAAVPPVGVFYIDTPNEVTTHNIPGGYTGYSYYKITTTQKNYQMGIDAPGGQASSTIVYEVRGALGVSPPDTTPPSNFTLSVTSTASTTIGLSWTASTDNVAVVAYDIYVNSVFNQTTGSTTATVTGLTSLTTYSIYVQARDAANNATNSNTVTPSTTSPSARTGLVLEWTGEQSDALSTEFPSVTPTAYKFQAWEHGYAYNASRVNFATPRAGNYAMQIQLRRPDMLDDRWRSEFVFFSLENSLDEAWYGASIFFPADLDQDANIENFLQWHDLSDPEDGTKIPAMGLNCLGNNYDLNIAWNDENPTNGWTDVHINLGSLLGDKGKWTDWVFYVKWDYRDSVDGGNGRVKIWKDGVVVLDRAGPNCFNDAGGPYFKIGLHRIGWDINLDTPRIIYFDEVRIGKANSSYNDVKPGN